MRHLDMLQRLKLSDPDTAKQLIQKQRSLEKEAQAEYYLKNDNYIEKLGKAYAEIFIWSGIAEKRKKKKEHGTNKSRKSKTQKSRS